MEVKEGGILWKYGSIIIATSDTDKTGIGKMLEVVGRQRTSLWQLFPQRGILQKVLDKTSGFRTGSLLYQPTSCSILRIVVLQCQVTVGIIIVFQSTDDRIVLPARGFSDNFAIGMDVVKGHLQIFADIIQ